MPRLSDDESVNSGKSAGRRNRKAKDEEKVVEVDISSRKDDRDRFAFAGDRSSGEVKGGGGGVVEWTTTVARPMSAWSYPEDEEPGAGNVRTRSRPKEAASEDKEAESGEEQVKVTVTEAKGSSSTSTTARTTNTSPTTTQLPPPSQDTSMEAREYHEIYSSSSSSPFSPLFFASLRTGVLSRSDHQREFPTRGRLGSSLSVGGYTRAACLSRCFFCRASPHGRVYRNRSSTQDPWSGYF